MNLVFLGPPGSGKGTQAARLARELGIVHLSSGDMLREAVRRETELGRKAGEYISKGELVPDDLMIEMIEENVSSGKLGGGFILDGFPRTVPQAEALGAMFDRHGISLDKAVLLRVSTETIFARLKGRAAQESRSDDTEEVIRRRLDVYEKQTRPIEEFYRRESILTEIKGEGTPENVFDAIVEATA